MVLRLIAGSPRRPGFDCLRRLPITACRAREGPTSPIDRLDPSIGGPGPHAFAVREECFRPRVKRAEHTHVHRLPLPTSVTIAIRPSCGGGMRADNHIFPKNGRGIFFAGGLDNNSDKQKRFVRPAKCSIMADYFRQTTSLQWLHSKGGIEVVIAVEVEGIDVGAVASFKSGGEVIANRRHPRCRGCSGEP